MLNTLLNTVCIATSKPTTPSTGLDISRGSAGRADCGTQVVLDIGGLPKALAFGFSQLQGHVSILGFRVLGFRV